MNTQTALLAAIAAQPDEDTPRLAYADFLDERNQGVDGRRARFIRVQIELALRTISERCMRDVNRLLSARAKRKPAPVKVSETAELVVEQHLLQLNHGQEWRYVACPCCNGRGLIERLKPGPPMSYRALLDPHYVPLPLKTEVVRCEACLKGDFSGLTCYLRHDSYGHPDRQAPNFPYRGTFSRGFIESVAVGMHEVFEQGLEPCPQCGGEKADTHSRCLKCRSTGSVRVNRITRLANRMLRSHPTIRRMYVTDVRPLYYSGTLRAVYALVGGEPRPATERVPDPIFRFIDWSNARPSDHSHGYSGWATMGEANDVLAQAVAKCVRHYTTPAPTPFSPG